MADKKPVVVYGANGFSGRLVAEFLREYNVPFIAAGRKRRKDQDVMRSRAGHRDGRLRSRRNRRLRRGTGESLRPAPKSFAICVGPFIYQRPARRRSLPARRLPLHRHRRRTALASRSVRKMGRKIRASAGLLIAPATAFMSTPSDIAARVCIEAAAIDTLEILTMFRGIPTFGSTQTIFAGIKTDAYYLEQNRYKPWPRATAYDVMVPGSVQTQLALTWGGFPHPVWYKNHPQVANVRSMGGILDRAIDGRRFRHRKTLRSQHPSAAQSGAGEKALRNGQLGASRNAAARKHARASHHRRNRSPRLDRLRAVHSLRHLRLSPNRIDPGLRSPQPDPLARR